jgi:hypothetical protein
MPPPTTPTITLRPFSGLAMYHIVCSVLTMATDAMRPWNAALSSGSWSGVTESTSVSVAKRSRGAPPAAPPLQWMGGWVGGVGGCGLVGWGGWGQRAVAGASEEGGAPHK